MIETEPRLLLEKLRQEAEELRSVVEASETLLGRTWDLLQATAQPEGPASASARHWRNVPGLLSARSRGKSADG